MHEIRKICTVQGVRKALCSLGSEAHLRQWDGANQLRRAAQFGGFNLAVGLVQEIEVVAGESGGAFHFTLHYELFEEFEETPKLDIRVVPDFHEARKFLRVIER